MASIGGERLGTAVLELTTDDSKLTAGLGAAEGRSKSTLARLNRAGKKMTTHLTLPIVAAGAASVKLAMDFEESMHQMSALAGISRKQVTAWSDEVLKLAPAMGKAPKELADALYFIASSGVPAAKAMSVLEASAKASAAGLGETEVVADAVTSAMNAYASTNLTAAEATDILVATVREGKGEATAIAAVIGQLLPLASELGVGFEEVGGSIAQMTRLGMPAAEAGTALQAVMSGLLKPSVGAADKLKSVGLSAAGLRDQLANQGVLSVLDTLNEKFHGNTDAIAEVFPNIRALRGALALAGKAGGDTAEVFKGVADSAGALDHAFEETQQGSAFKFRQSLAQLQVTGITLGNTLMPAFIGLLNVINDLASGFGDLSPQMQKVVLVGLGVVAALGPAIRVVTNLTVAVKALGAAALFLRANPIGLFITAAAAAAGAIAFLNSKLGGGVQPAVAYANAMDQARAALDRFKGSVMGAQQADLALAQSRLEVQAATQDLGRVQAQVRDGTLKGKDAALQLAQAELRVKQAKLNVRQASDQARKANASERTELMAHTRAKFAAVEAAKQEVQQAQIVIRMHGRTAENVSKLRSAQQHLKSATEAATKSNQAYTAGLSKAGRQAEDARNKSAALRDQMNKLKSKALNVKVDTTQAILAVVGLVAQMARLASKTIYVNVIKRDPKGSWNTQQAIENLRKEPKQRTFGIEFKSRGTRALESDVKKGAFKLKLVITKSVREAVAEAKKNLVSLASSIGDTLSAAIDKTTDRRTREVDSSPEGQRLAALDAQLDAEARARERQRLDQAIVDAETDADRREAQQELSTWLLEQERDALAAQLDARKQQITDEAEARKTALNQGLADLSDALNRGLITQAEYQTQVQALIAAQAPEYQNLGALLGESVARGYIDAFNAMMTQSGLVGFGGIYGGADRPEAISPEAVARQEAIERLARKRAAEKEALKKRLNAALARMRDAANNPGSPGGTTVTPAERQAIENLQKRIRGLASGGVVRGPMGLDRAGVFRLTRGEGVFRSSAMEGMQRWFEKGGREGGGVQVTFAGPVIGAGNERALARELARIIEPALNRRVSLG